MERHFLARKRDKENRDKKMKEKTQQKGIPITAFWIKD